MESSNTIFKTHRLLKEGSYLVVLTLFLALFGCGSDDNGISATGTEYSLSDITGNWTATEASFNGTDVVAEGGSVTLSVQSGGRFTFALNRPQVSNLIFTGKMGFDGEWLAVEYDTDPGEIEYYDIDMDASRNRLSIGANSEFDFDNDGTDELVIFFLDMTRD